MSNETITIETEARKLGKGNSREYRRQDMIPAIVYGPKMENTPITISKNAAVKYSARKYENTLFQFKSDNSSLKGLSVLMKDITFHPVSRRPVHIDFYAVDMTETVRVYVEIRYEGKAKGVSEEGGIFQTLLRDIEVECLPKDIPSALVADITHLGLNETLHISDLKMPTGVTPTATDDLALANVVQQREEEPAAATTAEAAPEAAAATPAATESDKK